MGIAEQMRPATQPKARWLAALSKTTLLGSRALCAAFSLMTAGYGLFIAALGKTPEAARGVATLATLLMVMMSGSGALGDGWD